MQHIFNAIILFILFLALSCSSCTHADTNMPSCINERTRQTIIRWGNYDVNSGKLHSYQFTGSLALATVHRLTYREQPVIDNIGAIKGEVFCKWLAKTIETFEDIQTLNAPGETARYVEYSSSKATIRAVWNPKYQTFGSKEFRALYDSLMTLIPDRNLWETK